MHLPASWPTRTLALSAAGAARPEAGLLRDVLWGRPASSGHTGLRGSGAKSAPRPPQDSQLVSPGRAEALQGFHGARPGAGGVWGPLCSEVCPLCRAQRLLFALLQEVAQRSTATCKVRLKVRSPPGWPQSWARCGPCLQPPSSPSSRHLLGAPDPPVLSPGVGWKKAGSWLGVHWRGVSDQSRGGCPCTPANVRRGHTLHPACTLCKRECICAWVLSPWGAQFTPLCPLYAALTLSEVSDLVF